MTEIPTIQASEYRSALHFTNTIRCSLGVLNSEQLPLYVQCGRSQFKITEENFEHIALGVLMAASWPDVLERQGESV